MESLMKLLEQKNKIMKILIWIRREDVISGSIDKYYTYLPFNEKYHEWVQVQITQDEFTKLEDEEK
jgi:hypothetical protein